MVSERKVEEMNPGYPILVFLILCHSAVDSSRAYGGQPQSADTSNESVRITIGLKITSKVSADSQLTISGLLLIKNNSEDQVLIESPTNRMALTFFVTDKFGNPIQPEFIGKADPGHSKITLKKSGTYEHKFDNLRFISGTGGLEYKLKNVEYRVIALYHPTSIKSPGFLSNEVTINNRTARKAM
jgi:hypothetical protein